MTNTEITGRLENWYFDLYFNVIWGQVYDDSKGRFIDGTLIHTSDLIIPRNHTRKDPPVEGDIMQTRNSRYLLGKERNPDWVL